MTFVPAGTTITASEDSILSTVDEAKSQVAYTKSVEIRAELSEQALKEINERIVPMEQDLSELRIAVNGFPDMVRTETRKAYTRGLYHGGLVGLVAGAVITFAICK